MRLRARHSKLVREYLESTGGEIQTTFLTPYLPDFNPVEFLWPWLERHALANVWLAGRGEVTTTSRNKLNSAWRELGLWLTDGSALQPAQQAQVRQHIVARAVTAKCGLVLLTHDGEAVEYMGCVGLVQPIQVHEQRVQCGDAAPALFGIPHDGRQHLALRIHITQITSERRQVVQIGRAHV